MEPPYLISRTEIVKICVIVLDSCKQWVYFSGTI